MLRIGTSSKRVRIPSRRRCNPHFACPVRARQFRFPFTELEALESRVLLTTTLYVDALSPGPAHNGASWATAYTDVQAALAAAVADTQILVAQGTYTPTATADRDATFQLKNNVALLGGYGGSTAPDSNARNTALYPTILSGNIGSATNATDNSYHVVTGSNTDATAVLDGFTVTAGYATGAGGYGSGMYNVSGSPTINQCVFTANNGGPAMFNGHSSLTLTQCTFSSNTHGAVENDQSTVTLVNSIFAGNSGYSAMYNEQSNVTLINSIFVGNAGPTCAAIINSNSTLTATDTLFVANSAQYGAAVEQYSYGSPALFVNCTFAGNSARDGAVYVIEGSAIVTNCIVWNNSGSNFHGNVTVTYSDVQGSYGGTGNISVDPQFIRLPSGSDYGDLRLRNTSPCIDAGDSTISALSSVTTDLAGAPRFQDLPEITDKGVGPGPVVDMGAYESLPVYVYYHGSVWDMGVSTAGAFASDKLPLLGGQSASFANYSSYSAGLNGIAVYIPGSHGPFSVSDFSFKVGNDNNPGVWADAPAPQLITSHTISGNATRITITWSDNAIQNTWLETTLKGGTGSTSGLPADLVFYFGSAPGETGNDGAGARVDMLDELAVRANHTASASITNPYDVNRDRIVNDADDGIARSHTTWFLSELHLITPPAIVAPLAPATSATSKAAETGNADIVAPQIMTASSGAIVVGIEASSDAVTATFSSEKRQSTIEIGVPAVSATPVIGGRSPLAELRVSPLQAVTFSKALTAIVRPQARAGPHFIFRRAHVSTLARRSGFDLHQLLGKGIDARVQ